jgi:hypothetical protein
MEGSDFRTRTLLSDAGPAASVPSASEPVIGVSISVGGPVGPVIAVPRWVKYRFILNSSRGEEVGMGSTECGNVPDSDVLYTVDACSESKGVPRSGRSRVRYSSRVLRVSFLVGRR